MSENVYSVQTSIDDLFTKKRFIIIVESIYETYSSLEWLSEAELLEGAEYYSAQLKESFYNDIKKDNRTSDHFTKLESGRIESKFEYPYYRACVKELNESNLQFEKISREYPLFELKEGIKSGVIIAKPPFERDQIVHILQQLYADCLYYAWLNNHSLPQKGAGNFKCKTKLALLHKLEVITLLKDKRFSSKHIARILSIIMNEEESYIRTELSSPIDQRNDPKHFDMICQEFNDIPKFKENLSNMLLKRKD